MERELIKHIYDDSAAFGGKTVTLGGWVRNLRDSKETFASFFNNNII